MIRTIYKCDECGKEQEKNHQMWKVVIAVYSNLTSPVKSADANVAYAHHWCRECLAKYSLTGFVKEEAHEEKIIPPPTFGEKIELLLRDIVKEETQ